MSTDSRQRARLARPVRSAHCPAARAVQCGQAACNRGRGNPACYKTLNQDTTWLRVTPFSVYL